MAMEFTGLREWLFPPHRPPRALIAITGERSVSEGVVEPDRSINYQRVPDHVVDELSDPQRTRAECTRNYNGHDLEISGGIPNIESWQTLFLTADHPYTLESLQNDIDSGHSMPLIYDYPNAIRKRVEEVEESFRGLHRYDRTNWHSIPHIEAREVGRKRVPEGKPAINSPDWELWRVHSDGTHDVISKSTPVPFVRGEGSFLIYLGPSVFDPQMKQYLAIGDRGASTEAANALYLGRKTWERERKLPDGTVLPPDVWSIEGGEKLAGEIWSYIEKRTLPYHGIQIGAQTFMQEGKVYRIGDLLDLEFIRFVDSKPQRVFATGSLDLSKYITQAK